MKKHIIEVGITLFVVLFMRLTIMDSGFLLGFKDKVGFTLPVQVVEYQSHEKSAFRRTESYMALQQVVAQYDYVLVGSYEDEWYFFDDLEAASAESVQESFGKKVLFFSLISLIAFAFAASRLSREFSKPTKIGWFFIPIYNIYLFLEVTGMSKKWLIGLFIPYINIIVYGVLWGKIANKLGRNPWLFGITIPVFANIPALFLKSESSHKK